MIQIPRDVWLHIALFIPNEEIRDRLLGVNSVFYDLSLRLRYETVSITEVGQKTAWILNRLRDPAISCRVRRLILRPQYRVRSPITLSHPQSERVGSLQRFADSLTGYANRYLGRASPEPVVKATHAQKMDQLILLAMEVIPNLVNVIDFSLDAWNIPSNVDLLTPVATAWRTFGKQLQSLALTGYPQLLKHVTHSAQLDSLRALSLDFTNDLNNRDSESDPSASVEKILPFVSQLAPQLHDLSIASWTNVDLSNFFDHLPPFPQLEHFHIRAIFEQAFGASAVGLTRLLSTSSTTLKDVQLKLRSNFHGEIALANWLDSVANDCPDALKDLKTFQVDPTTCAIGFDAAKRLAARSGRSLTRLVIRVRYLHYQEVEDLFECIGDVTSIEALQICVHVLNVELLRLVCKKCPDLKSLRLYISKIGSSEEDGPDMFREEIRQQSWPNWPVEELDIWQSGSEMDVEFMRLLAAAIPSVRSFWCTGRLE